MGKIGAITALALALLLVPSPLYAAYGAFVEARYTPVYSLAHNRNALPAFQFAHAVCAEGGVWINRLAFGVEAQYERRVRSFANGRATYRLFESVGAKAKARYTGIRFSNEYWFFELSPFAGCGMAAAHLYQTEMYFLYCEIAFGLTAYFGIPKFPALCGAVSLPFEIGIIDSQTLIFDGGISLGIAYRFGRTRA